MKKIILILTDLVGRMVGQGDINHEQQFIDIEQLESGIYNLTIKEGTININQLQFIKIN
jgi:hypothetical protein